MEKARIDWSNHFVAFLSSLVGIFIAFQLQAWEESSTERGKLDVAMKAIKEEIDSNLKIYAEDSLALKNWSAYASFLWAHSELRYKLLPSLPGTMLATDSEMKNARRQNSGRLSDLKLIRKFDDSLNVYGPVVFNFDTSPKIGISTEAWESAKSLGVLTNLDYATLTSITRIYQVIYQDLGVNNSDILKELILRQDYNSEAKIKMFGDLGRIYVYKSKRITRYYREVNWGQ